MAGGESAPRLDSKSPSKGELGKNTTMVNEGNEQKSAPVGLSTSMSFSRFSLSFDQSEGYVVVGFATLRRACCSSFLLGLLLKSKI